MRALSLSKDWGPRDLRVVEGKRALIGRKERVEVAICADSLPKLELAVAVPPTEIPSALHAPGHGIAIQVIGLLQLPSESHCPDIQCIPVSTTGLE